MGLVKRKKKQSGETDFQIIEEEKDYESMLIKHRRRMASLMVVFFFVAIGLVVCVKIFLDHRVYENYEVTNTIEMGDVAKCKFYRYGEGVLRYSNDGISYMIGDNTVWNQAFEMKQPIVDVCREYMAIADLEGTGVYIYDVSGRQGEIQTDYPIIALEVSRQGVVAVITKSDVANVIEVYAKDGTNIAKGQTVLSGDGTPVCLSISEDGTKLAVSYVYLSDGQAQTRVVFYNYSEVGKNEAGRIMGGFDYEGSLVSRVEFVTNDVVVSYADDGITIYNMEERPSVKKEIKIEKEIESVFYSDQYVGVALKDESTLNRHTLHVYDLSGRKVLDTAVEFPYREIQIQKDIVVLNNSEEMYMLTMSGVKKFQGKIEEGIVKVIPLSLENRFLIITNQNGEEIKLK